MAHVGEEFALRATGDSRGFCGLLGVLLRQPERERELRALAVRELTEA